MANILKILKPIGWRRAAVSFLGLSLALILALGSAAFYLNTEAGQRQLVNWINEEFQGIKLGDIDGSIFSSFTLSSFALTDQDGIWLEIENTQIGWSPLALLSRRVSISALDAETISLLRAPRPDEDVRNDKSVTWPTLPVDLDISSLDIGRLELRKAVLGLPTAFQGTASLKLMRSNALSIEARLTNLRREKENLSLNVSFSEGTQMLDVDVQLFSDEGGTLATLSGLDGVGALAATLKGSGPIDNWLGTLNVQAGTAQIIDAKLQRQNQVASLRAQLNTEGLEMDNITSLFGRTATLDIDLDSKGRDKHDLTINLAAETIRLHAETASAKDIAFSLEVLDAAPFNQIIAPVYVQPFALNGTVTDLLAEPRVKAVFQELRAAMDTRFASRFSGQIRATSQAGSIEFNAQGQASDISVSAATPVMPLLTPGLDWRIEGKYDQKSAALALSNLSISNPLLAFDSSARLSTETGAVTSTLKAQLTDISTLSNELSGAATLTAKINTNTDGGFDISDAVLETEHVHLAASATISAERMIDAAQYQLLLSNLDTIESLGQFKLDGRISAQGTVSGHLASPSFTFETGMEELDIQNVKFQDLTLQAQAQDIAANPSGQIDIAGASDLGPLTLTAKVFKEESTRFSVPELQISLGSFHAGGGLSIADDGLTTGDIALSTKSNEHNIQDLSGFMEGIIRLMPDGRKQAIATDIQLVDLIMTEQLTLKSGEVSSTILIDQGQSQISAKIRLLDLVHPYLQAKHVKLDIEHQDGRTDYNLDLESVDYQPYSLSLTGHSERLDPNARKITLTIDGHIAEHPLRTSTPIISTLNETGFSVQPFALLYGDGVLEASFNSDLDILEAALMADSLDLTPIKTFIPDTPAIGTISGQLKLSSRPNSLGGDFGFTLSHIKHGFGSVELDEALEISVTGQFKDKMTSLTGQIQLDDLPSGRFSADLPVTIDVLNSHIAFPNDQAMKASIVWQGDISPVWPLFGFINHDLAGRLDAGLNISGTYENPDIDGEINLKEGRYENIQLGFVATDIDLTSTIKDRQLTLNHLTATDGGNGTISAMGNIYIHPDLDVDAQAELALSGFHIIRQPRLNVQASSNLQFQKNAVRTILSGDITVDRAHVGAITKGGPNIPELDVQEINKEGEDLSEAQTATRYLGPLILDLSFSAPGTFFIQSYGLDSEWQADLNLSGTSQDPIVNGTASLIRGLFQFSGKTFALSSGTLTFPGDRSNDPDINIIAEYLLPDLRAILRITGQASQPVLEITSSPELPRDEVLSRILFGTSVAQLTPLEAIQLASAVHSLSNGGGAGLTGGVRRALGLDRFYVESGNGREYGTTITGGKYLSDNVYIEVTTAPTTGESATSIEVSLTPNLSLVTRRTLDQDNNLAIRWSWDY